VRLRDNLGKILDPADEAVEIQLQQPFLVTMLVALADRCADNPSDEPSNDIDPMASAARARRGKQGERFGTARRGISC
jgi:hypothetical protein